MVQKVSRELQVMVNGQRHRPVLLDSAYCTLCTVYEAPELLEPYAAQGTVLS